MSSGFYDRFETQHGKSRSKDNEIYVSGIPIDLDKAGLENIFIKAGTIESVRIIPPKIANSTTTFGFVTYKHRTSAALAIETFNLFKFNGKTFTVRYSDNAQQSASTSSSTMRSSAFMTPAPSNSQINGDDIPNSTFIETPISIANKSLDVSKINVSTLIDSNIMNIDELHKRSSMGRGVFHQSKNQKGPVFNTMRPYARRLYQSRTHLSNTSIESDTSVSLIPQQQLKTPSVTNHLPIKSSNSVNSYKQATLTVGETYQINITHVNSPANFFIHLAASLSKKADFINNLDNYYRNDLSTNEKDEFCDMDAGAIRCKLYNIEPVSGREWCPSSIELLNSLQKTQDETLEVKVYSCDNYNQPETGRIEKIYAVDILFGGEDSVIDYMLSNNLAKNNENLERKFRFENDFPSVHHAQDFELTQDSSSQFGNDNDDDDEYNDHFISRSVSQANICDTFLQDEHRRLTTSHTNPRERRGLFNCSFPVWKRRDLLGCVHSFKTGQTSEVIISWIHDSQRFYIQEATKRFAQLTDLEENIGRYANVLLKDAELRTELFTYQNKSSKFDVVLVLYEAKWHRAIFLDKETRKDILIAANLESDSDCYDENYDEKFYFSFFLIDHGRNIYIIVRQNDPKTNIFILPLTSKLIQVGYFALKCSINEAYTKQRDSYITHDCTEQLKHMARFERHFKQMLQGKQIQMRISQLNRFKDEDEAIVELFYTPEQVKTLLPMLLNVNELNSENVNPANLLVSSASTKMRRLLENQNNVVDLKTNCVYYVLQKAIAPDENEEQQQKLVGLM